MPFEENDMNIFKTLDKEKVKELYYLGYTKIGAIDPKVLAELKRASEQLVRQTQKKYPKGELFNLINSDWETKMASNKMVGDYLLPYLETILNTEKVDIRPVSHLIKPFGLKSGIWHQDSSIVDERTDFSLNAWMSLVDSTQLNGCLWIFPGSHINENHFRQFGFNPVQGKLLKKLDKYLIPIETKAGEVLLFHRNLIHGSSRNWLPVNRIAVEGIVVPKNVQFYNFHREESVSKNKILGFQVDMEHFLRSNPKDDFYNGRYKYVELHDPGFEGIAHYLEKSIPLFEQHAKKMGNEVSV